MTVNHFARINTVFPTFQFFNIIPTILVSDLDVQIKHKYYIDLRISSFIGDPYKNMRSWGIVARRKHS